MPLLQEAAAIITGGLRCLRKESFLLSGIPQAPGYDDLGQYFRGFDVKLSLNVDLVSDSVAT